MGNPINSIFSGLGNVVGSIFGSQLNFLSGKSCSSLCGPTWDLPCYIENFCIEHLLKFFAVSFLFYIVLLLLYFIYKLGVCHCVFRVTFKMIWGCFSRIFSFWENGCRLLCGILSNVHQRRISRRHRRDIEMAEMGSRSDQEFTDVEPRVSYHKEPYRNRRRLWSRDHKRSRLRRSLKAKSHRVHVGVDGGDSVYITKRKHIKHGDVRVIRTSSFAKKGPNHKRSTHVHKKT